MVVDNVQMGQVFSNLIGNAIDAMPQGGRLRVAVDAVGEYLVVRISDTGVGIDPDYLDRIFLPFVGTKGALSGSETPGMGLGLAVVQGIIASHGGDISVESTPGKGTTFTIRLPIEAPGGNSNAQSVGPRP
jgi:signal transduction histidine kinase